MAFTETRLDADALASARVIPGPHEDEIGSRSTDFVFDRSPGAGAERDHRQHGGHADDDPEHREQRAQRISTQRAQGERRC